MYSKHVTLLTFLLISLLLTYQKGQYSLFVLNVPLNPNQSICGIAPAV